MRLPGTQNGHWNQKHRTSRRTDHGPSPQTPLPPGPGHRSGPKSHFPSVIVIVILVCLCNFTFAQVKLSDITEQPSSDVGRFSNAIPPKVLMGLAHVPHLADVDPNDWTYVREHLEGVWMNLALTGSDRAKKILTSLKTRDYYFIAGVSAVNYDSKGTLLNVTLGIGGVYNTFKDMAIEPRLVMVNDYVSKNGGDESRYYGPGYVDAAKKYVLSVLGNNPFGNRFYITTRAGHFSSSVYDKTYDPQKTGPLKGRAFSTMQDVSGEGGFAYERAAIDILSPENKKAYIQSFNRSRELGAELLWLCPRGQTGQAKAATDGLVNAYKWFAENKIFPDKIVITAYSRTAKAGGIPYLSMTPMINPKDPDLIADGSFTGALYWCIKQREKALKKVTH